MLRAALVFGCMLLLGGCAALPGRQNYKMTSLSKLPGDRVVPPKPSDGAIYAAAGEGAIPLQLFRDHRSFRVGDLLTIDIVEKASASKSVNQKINRKSDVANNVASFFGFPLNFGHSSSGTQFSPQLGVTTTNTLNGTGQTAQNNSFTDTLTAMVVRIQPNGNLVIRGENKIHLEGGDEFIRIAGVVRPADVSADNVVQSTRIAEARMEFSGNGETYLAPKMGLLQKIFLSVATGAILSPLGL